MYSLIAILGPSVIGLKLMDYFKKGLNIKNVIYYYLILLVLSSASTNIIVYYLLSTKGELFDLLNNSVLYFGEYTLINVLVNIIWALIIYILCKNISFDVVVKEVDVNAGRNKKKKMPKKRLEKFRTFFKAKRQKNR